MEETVNRSALLFIFLWKEGNSAAEIVRRLHHVFGDDTFGRTTVFKWLERFKTGRQSLEDDQRSGRPKASDDDEKAKVIKDVVLSDRCLTVSDIAAATGFLKIRRIVLCLNNCK